ncbi:MAG: RluA family pseudouridine synthase [bacterium]|nr:RluA family pseudouridine synthase [bacterium]
MKLIYDQNSKERLDKYLQEKLDITRSQIKKIILAGKISVNDKPSSVHHWLKSGDQIIFDDAQEKITKVKFEHEPIIIDQNEEFLVIEKPSGMLAHPTDKGEKNTLANWLLKKYPKIKKIGDDPRRPGIVHRLDKEVSGLMVVALSQESFESLKKQFQKRTLKKRYIALVHGALLNSQGKIDQPLERDKKTGLMKVQSNANTGKSALTIYAVIKKFINFTLLKIEIKTGRMHQIRAHFYSIGHSVVGDNLYQTKDLRKNHHLTEKTVNKRIFLHAGLLKFKDLSGEWRKYESPLPKELKDFLLEIK